MQGPITHRRIAHYTIVEELGRGGMGTVYKAKDETLDRFVALKVLGEHLMADPEAVQRFLREAKSAAALSHPHIVQIHAVGEENGRHYFVMEHVPGRTLDQVVRSEGRVDVRRSAQWVLEAARGLAAAHDQGVLHRDVKPANLIFDRHGRIKIADFGLALSLSAANRLTATGMLMGTPGYLAPEQCEGSEADPRTDLYSLGITWYELLTGVLPFSADSPAAVLVKILQSEPPPVEELRPEVDPEVRRILGRMMAKKRQDRFPDAHALIAELERFLAVPAATDKYATTSPSAPTTLLPATPTPPPLPVAQAAPGRSVSGSPEEGPRLSERRELVGPQGLRETPPAPPAGVPPGPAAGLAAEPLAAPAPHAPAERKRSWLGWAAAAVMLLLLFGGLAGARQLGWLDGGRTEPHAARAFEPKTNAEEDNGAALPAEDPTTAVTVPAGSVELPEAVHMSDLLEQAEQTGQTVTLPRLQDPDTAQRQAAREVSSALSGGGSAAAPETDVSAGAASRPRASQERAEPPAEPALPPASGVAVVVVGEPLLAGHVEEMLEERLGGSGALLVDEKGLPGGSRLAGADEGTDAGAVLSVVRGRAARLLLARVEYLGSRELYYLGRSEDAFQSRVTITVFDATTGEPVAPSASEVVEYTQLSAPHAARQALRRIAADLGPLVRR